MTPTLAPTPAELLRCARETLEQVLAPSLEGDMERSAATTMSHVLSYVERRIELEGQALLDELNQLHELFAQAIEWLATQQDAERLRSAIEASLAETPDPRVYPSLDLMARRVAVRRQHVCDLLELLRAPSPDRDGERGNTLHQLLRDYVGWQLSREAMVVEPAFFGRGPRR